LQLGYKLFGAKNPIFTIFFTAYKQRVLNRLSGKGQKTAYLKAAF
jgi:hypothetical protein